MRTFLQRCQHIALAAAAPRWAPSRSVALGVRLRSSLPCRGSSVDPFRSNARDLRIGPPRSSLPLTPLSVRLVLSARRAPNKLVFVAHTTLQKINIGKPGSGGWQGVDSDPRASSTPSLLATLLLLLLLRRVVHPPSDYQILDDD